MPRHDKYHFAHLKWNVSGGEYYDNLLYHHNFLRFHTQLVECSKRVGKKYCSIHSDQFQAADYPGLLDTLDAGEQSIVDELLKNGRRQDEIVWQVINYRMYRQIQTIARGSTSIDGIASWVRLYNGFMESAGRRVQEKSSLRIYMADSHSFAVYFLEHILDGIKNRTACLEPFFAQEGEMSRMLENLQSSAFPETSFDRFLEWVQLYQTVASKDFEEGE